MVHAAASGAPAPGYRLERSIALGAGERWDYAAFDPIGRRVYISHGDRVTVVDAAKNTVIGDIGPFPGGTHGIATANDQGIGYTDDGKAGTVGAFDLKSLTIIKTIPAAPDADSIVFDKASGHVFVIDGDSGAITVIDPKKNASVATIEVGAGLEAAVADGDGHLLVDGVDRHEIVKIDTRTNAVLAHYAMPGCERPHGIAADPATHRVFATCINRVMIAVNTDTGENVASLPIGMGSDGAAFDPVHKRVLSSNGEGTLSVIEEVDANHFKALPDVVTARGARTMTIDPATGRLFLPAADVAKVDPPTTTGGRPHVTYVTGSMKLLVLAPAP
jgi:YVTN family beta-propeller protein